ncbi:MAG: amidohydrolase [Gemmatimonadetes bacterium]|nr:amidohydrolase [Gemmatimonadota bacterium]
MAQQEGGTVVKGKKAGKKQASAKGPRIVDFHNHYYPPAYLDAITSGRSGVTMKMGSDGNPELHYPGDYNVLVLGHRDINFRQRVLEKEGIATQVLTLTTPGTHVEEPKTAVALAQMVNDAFARTVQERAPRFTALATLPLNDPAASVTELERAMTQLKLPGAMLFSNVNGVALADKRFWPLYEKANELGAVLHIHPESPYGVQGMTDYWLTALVGFLCDTTLATAHLVFAGVPERFPRIRWALGHLGGAIPYIAERLDRGYRAFSECRANIRRPPSSYLKKFYYDTVNFDPDALMLAVKFAGAKQILAGSDYPHMIGSIQLMKKAIGKLPLPAKDKAGIFGGNAARLLKV